MKEQGYKYFMSTILINTLKTYNYERKIFTYYILCYFGNDK